MAEHHPEELWLDHETVKKTIGSLPSKQAQDFVRVYGSLVTVSSNVFELSLIFGQALGDDPADAHIEQRASVTMSWHAAKAFAGLLVNTIRNYERQAGEINLPSPLAQSDEPASE